jgi:hypothetical protein
MNDDSLMDQMFRTFDHDTEGFLSCSEWLTGLWIFLRGNVTEQITYCFQVKNLNFDNKFKQLMQLIISLQGVGHY